MPTGPFDTRDLPLVLLGVGVRVWEILVNTFRYFFR